MGSHSVNHLSAVDRDDSVMLVNPDGQGRMVIVCEHASNWIPQEYNNLGLDDVARMSHIAWDPGALQVAGLLSAEFDAPLITPGVSRLVFDCNRHIQAKSAIVETNDSYVIPGNAGLSDADRHDRAQRFYTPYHSALSNILDRAEASNRSPAIVTIHSFTPVYFGHLRNVEIGILYDDDGRLASEIFNAAETEGEYIVRLNEPYSAEDGVTYTLAEHAVPRGLLNVMVEVRSDLIEDADAQKNMAGRLAGYLKTAFQILDGL